MPQTVTMVKMTPNVMVMPLGCTPAALTSFDAVLAVLEMVPVCVLQPQCCCHLDGNCAERPPWRRVALEMALDCAIDT